MDKYNKKESYETFLNKVFSYIGKKNIALRISKGGISGHDFARVFESPYFTAKMDFYEASRRHHIIDYGSGESSNVEFLLFFKKGLEIFCKDSREFSKKHLKMPVYLESIDKQIVIKKCGIYFLFGVINPKTDSFYIEYFTDSKKIADLLLERYTQELKEELVTLIKKQKEITPRITELKNMFNP